MTSDRFRRLTALVCVTLLTMSGCSFVRAATDGCTTDRTRDWIPRITNEPILHTHPRSAPP
jgi:hypothetical protein